MPESLELSIVLPVTAEEIFTAWLDSHIHGLLTGSPAQIDPQIGGVFTAWDGYIQGRTLDLIRNQRIVQSWRTSDFPTEAPDSILEIQIESIPDGARLTLVHKNIPDGQSGEYEQGWLDYYFAPMQAYYSQAKS